jgi:hypothetical protein
VLAGDPSSDRVSLTASKIPNFPFPHLPSSLALCAAFVACLFLPLGQLLFPYLDIVLPFDMMEAVVSATLGFGLG